ncbi:MAG: serine/threonine-protein kinase [Myxococcaceae bacterium]
MADEKTSPDPALSLTATAASPRPAGTLDRLGRYVITERLGAGAMGVVFAANDPELQRTVALKLLSGPDGATPAQLSPFAREQLMKEARAAARVQHPNVVAIYDVLSEGDALGLAMELVRGGSLRDWLRDRRPWKEVARVLLEAGRGLEAVHAAGILHRDFKPANVLVGEDARARVADFGLAHAPTDASAGGGLVGTPAYMSAQALASQPPTTADDVYAFCVTAWEALYGRRPSRAETLEGLRESASQPPPPVPPSDAPASLGEALRRGLHPERAERASLTEVLAAFEKVVAPRASRVPLFVGLALLALATVVGVVGTTLQRRIDQRCLDLSTKERLGQPPGVDGTPLDAWAGRWRALRREVCLGGGAKQLSSREREAVGFCLDEQRLQFKNLALAVVSPRVGPAQREALLALSDELPTPESCLEVGAPAKVDTSVVLSVDTLRESGDAAGAVTLASQALDGGIPARLEATLRWSRAQAFNAQGDGAHALEDCVAAAALAEKLHDETLRAAALVGEAGLLVRVRQDDGAAQALLASLGPLVERAGTPQTRVDADLVRGTLDEHAGRLDEALAAYTRAGQLAAKLGDSPRELKALANELDLRVARIDATLFPEAERIVTRARALSAKVPGSLVGVLDGWAAVLRVTGRTTELGVALAEQRELLSKQTSPKAELLRALADWQWVEATGDVEAATRLRASVKQVRALGLPVDDELAVMDFQATWVLDGLSPALAALEAEHARVGDDDGTEHLPWLLLARFLSAKWPAPGAMPEDLDAPMESAWWAMRSAVALHAGGSAEGLEHVSPPPFPGSVRASPMWVVSEGLRAVLLTASGKKDEGRAVSEALQRELGSGPTSAWNLAWAKRVDAAVKSGCGGRACVEPLVAK